MEKIPTFYKEVISTWERICIGTSCDLEFILSESLWDNHSVRCKGKTNCNKRLESKGILMVVGLIDDDDSALGKSCRENLICRLFIFLNGMGFCTLFLENEKTES